MKAVEDIQSIIDKIDSETQPGAVKTETETPTLDPKAVDDPKKDEQDSSKTGDEGKEKETDAESLKQAHAFAAMRKENADLKKQLEELKAQTQSKKDGDDPQVTKQDDKSSEEKSDIVKALEERLAKLEGEQKKELETKKLSQQAYELSEIKKTYGLSNDALFKFAEDAEKRGINLGESNLPMMDIYRIVYHEQIVQSEVDRIKKEIQQNSGNFPETGPDTTGAGKNTIQSVNDMLELIEKQTSKK